NPAYQCSLDRRNDSGRLVQPGIYNFSQPDGQLPASRRYRYFVLVGHLTRDYRSRPANANNNTNDNNRNNNNPNNITPEAVQTMIGQALLRNFGGGDGSHSSHAENPRNMHTARPCYYADFMKCHLLNFKGTEGAIGLIRWIKKMESVFNISGCTVENQ
nr:reverse transcriptase domain-containing protein [Tanacetum cinerariifolium]